MAAGECGSIHDCPRVAYSWRFVSLTGGNLYWHNLPVNDSSAGPDLFKEHASETLAQRIQPR